MQMGIILAGTTGRLQHDVRADIEIDSGATAEYFLNTGVTCLHEGREQGWMAVEPAVQRLGHGQHDMPVGDPREQPATDEVDP